MDELIFKLVYQHHVDSDESMLEIVDYDTITIQEFVDTHKWMNINEMADFFSAMRFDGSFSITETIMVDYEMVKRIERFFSTRLGKSTIVTSPD
jgi:hypothetical protein